MNDIKKIKIPINEKYVLTREEAMSYFNIGEKKMRKIINDNIGTNTFIVFNGRKALIIRERFEEFMNNVSSL